MKGPALHFTGLDELVRDLRKIADKDLKDEMKAANKQIADQVIRLALPRVPVRSGRLKASVRGSGTLAGAIGRAGSARVPYAAAIHWGRKRGGVIQGRPFLWDAAKSVERDVADDYLKAIERVLAQVNSR